MCAPVCVPLVWCLFVHTCVYVSVLCVCMYKWYVSVPMCDLYVCVYICLCISACAVYMSVSISVFMCIICAFLSVVSACVCISDMYITMCAQVCMCLCTVCTCVSMSYGILPVPGYQKLERIQSHGIIIEGLVFVFRKQFFCFSF